MLVAPAADFAANNATLKKLDAKYARKIYQINRNLDSPLHTVENK